MEKRSKTRITTKHAKQLLPRMLDELRRAQTFRPDLVVAAWPSLVGKEIAAMTKALSFEEGVLYIAVSNSTLYSVLAHNEKRRLIALMKKKFPQANVKNICFKIG